MPTSTIQNLTAQGAILTERVKDAADLGAGIFMSHLIILEIVGFLVAAAFVAGTIDIIIKTGWFDQRVKKARTALLTTETSRRQAARSWSTIERHFFAGNDNDLKVALIEADKLLDEALRNAGVFGTTLGDRLKKVRPALLPNIEEVWQAHKLRNQIAHEGNFSIKRDTAERALTIYKNALQSLGAIPSPQKTEAATAKAKTSDESSHH
jgi:hypothetical protein